MTVVITIIVNNATRLDALPAMIILWLLIMNAKIVL